MNSNDENVTANEELPPLDIQLLLNYTNNFEFSNETIANGTATASQDDPMMLKIVDFLNVYYLGFIIILGVFGNAFNFISFLRTQSNKLSSPSYYLVSLALTDVVFLAVLLISWLAQFDGFDLFNRLGFCQALVYLNSVSSCMSSKSIFKY